MNTDPITVEQQRVIAEAAASYTPPEPQSHAVLMPHLESIATLRSKGASYRAIVKILGKVNISVSLDTLSRFCRETIEQKTVRKSRRRSTFLSSPKLTGGQPPDAATSRETPESPGPAKGTNATEAPTVPRGKGPRIADPNSI